MVQMLSSGLTDIGQVRSCNQDSFCCDDALGLYMVADGMGGHKAGDVASRITVATVREVLSAPPPHPQETEDDPSLSSPANRLLAAIREANRRVHTAARDDKLRGMGATVAAVLFSGNALIAANAGDSPIFLIHHGKIQALSVPHTLAAEMRTDTDPEDLPPDPSMHHVLTRAVGVGEDIFPHLCEVPLFRGDGIVIASDGLTNKVSTEEIRRTAVALPPPIACRRLVSLANARGGEDNITIVIAAAGRRHSLVNRFGTAIRAAFQRVTCGSKHNSFFPQEGIPCRS